MYTISTIRYPLTALIACSVVACNPLVTITDETDLPDFFEKSDRSLRVDQSPTVNLANLAQRVRSNHPELQAARLTIKEAQGRLLQAGRLENPELGIGIKKSIPDSEGELELSYSQRFPVTNKLSLEKRVSQDHVKIARQEIKVAELSFIRSAQLLAVEILHLEEKEQNLEAQKKTLMSITQFIEEAAKRGELSPLDAAQTRLEVEALNNQKLLLQQQKLTKLNQLKEFLGLESHQALNLKGSLPAVKPSRHTLQLHKHPQFKAQQLAFELAKSEILLEKSRRYDDIEMEVSGAIGREEDAPEGLETEQELGFGIRIPLPLHNDNAGNIKASIAKAKRQQIALSALRQKLKNRAHSQKLKMNTWLAQNKRIETSSLPLAKKTSRSLEDIYKKGQGSFTDMLKAKRNELELESKLLENTLEFHKARVRYFAALAQQNNAF